ncbi:MAG: hypothetical protein U0840_15315 [Gemmataceae bacterium]
MFHRNLINSLLAAFALLAVSSLAQAACCPPACGCGSAVVSAAPITRTITVMEMVPEQYETTRTSYKTETVQEAYTAYRTECVPETRTIQKPVTRWVEEWKDVTVTTYKTVPTMETRTVMKKVQVQEQVTTIERKTVRQTHYVTECVPVRRLCAKKSSCCDPCGCPTECQEFREKTKKVREKVCVECPVTKTVCKTVCVPETVTVCVNKCVPCTEVKKVCCKKCVTEYVAETCTVNVTKCVPYTATRCVTKCVPVCEKVICTRMVCKPVQKTITECAPTCCEPTCCEPVCCEKAKKSRKCR